MPEQSILLDRINKIRNSGVVCCFSIHSDYNYCWWCEWSYPDKDGHKTHRTGNYDELEEALSEAERSI